MAITVILTPPGSCTLESKEAEEENNNTTIYNTATVGVADPPNAQSQMISATKLLDE